MLAGNTNSRAVSAAEIIHKIKPRSALPLYTPRPHKQKKQRPWNRTRVAPLRTTVPARRHYFPRQKIKQRTAGTGSKRERHAGKMVDVDVHNARPSRVFKKISKKKNKKHKLEVEK